MPGMAPLRVLEFVRYDDGVWNLPRVHVDRLAAEFPGVRFDSPADRAECDRLLPEADIVLGWGVRRANFASASRLKWIQLTAAGVGGTLFPEMVESPIIVTNARGVHAVSMAEHALGVMLMLARKLHLARDAQRRGHWSQEEQWASAPPIDQLAGATLGLVGLGAVGGAIAARARSLGMRVRAVRRHPAHDPAPADEQWGSERLHELIRTSDWLVLAAPLTPETRGVIGRAELALMPPEARSRRVDICARVNGTPSAVPWTSTKWPAPVITTFMSVSQPESSS